MEINVDRAKEVFDRLLQIYQKKEFPFDQLDAQPPQIKENLPVGLVWGSREHACYLFALCYWMRGGIDSHTATRAVTELYNLCPEMFLPEKVLSFQKQMILPRMERQFTPHYLTFDFRNVGLGFNSEQNAEFWINNWIKVNRLWGGDPRNIFRGISTYEEACGRIQNKRNGGFQGFQEKMVSMLTYFYMDAGIIDRWHFPIPVDFHALRTVFSHRIIVADQSEANGNGFYTKPILAAVRGLFMDYCVKHSVDPIILCEAVWLYSRLMCRQYPGNTSKVGGRHGRKTELVSDLKWTRAKVKTYEKSCMLCQVQKTCMWSVPSAEYYIGGKLVLRGEREEPPQGYLFSLFD